MKILAIETSCDETSVAILEAEGGLKNPSFKILSNIVLSQIKLHAKWGGVVPNLAKREHSKNLVPILKKSLQKAKILKNPKPKARNPKQISSSKLQEIKKILEREPELLEQFLKFIPTIEIPKIDALAVTVGPGLEPALWVGINFAKALSLVWGKPIVAVNHMEGHMTAVLLKQNSGSMKHEARSTKKGFEFPALALLVSGGHTELVLIKDWGDYKVVGETRDDAAGECFDKCARMLGLPYPGGPSIAKRAELSQPARLKSHNENLAGKPGTVGKEVKQNIKLPRPMIDSKDYDFSFSGLKTAVLYMIRNLKEKNIDIENIMPEICHKIQQSIIDVLISKTIKAAEDFSAKSIIIGGGVAANQELRKQIKRAVVSNSSELTKKTTLFLPSAKLTTDNAAMIAAAGYFQAQAGKFAESDKLMASGNLSLPTYS